MVQNKTKKKPTQRLYGLGINFNKLSRTAIINSLLKLALFTRELELEVVTLFYQIFLPLSIALRKVVKLSMPNVRK